MNTEEFLKKVRDRWHLAVEANREQYERAKADLEFCDPEKQWPENIKNLRGDKPCLVVDVLTPIVKQIVNEQRQNRPAIKVSAVDSQADIATARVYQGIVRHIEYISDADIAYDRATDSQVRAGLGFIRVTTDYSDPMSFDQEIKILSVPNPGMVELDPSSTNPDGSDANWAFIAEDLLREDYKDQYPDSKLGDMDLHEWEGVCDELPDWMSSENGGACRVVEYFEKVMEPATLYKFEDESVSTEKEAGKKVIATRKTFLPKVRWYKLNAIEILEETTWECEYIPIIPVYGDELIIDKKKSYFGIIHRAKDVQRMINVWKSVQTEVIGLSSKAPWIACKEATEGHEDVWASANTKNWNMLPWNAYDDRDRQNPQPFRDVQEPPIQAITIALQGSMNDIKAVTGMYDPNLGMRDSASQSGVAIKNLQHQGQVGNFHFQDNMARSIRHLGRIMIQLIRKYYDTARIIRTIGPDDSEKLVLINGQADDAFAKGQDRHYDLKSGRYDVTVSVGPSYSSKRQENLTTLLDFMKMLPPEQASFIADLIASQVDAPIAEEVARRLKLMLPPQMQEEKKGQNQIPPQIQQQMQEMMAQHEALTAKVHDLMNQLEDQDKKLQAEMLKAQLDSQTKIAIAQMNNETDLIKTEVQINAQQGQTDLLAQLQDLQAQQQAMANYVMQLAASQPQQPPLQEAQQQPTPEQQQPQPQAVEAQPQPGPQAPIEGAGGPPANAGPMAGME